MMRAQCHIVHRFPHFFFRHKRRYGDTVLTRQNISLRKMIEKEEENIESNERNLELDFSAPEKQEARAYLRERFLRVITGIVGEEAKFNLYENSCVAGEFRGIDVDCLEVFVRKLDTPLGVIPEAILRANDIISMSVDIKRDRS